MKYLIVFSFIAVFQFACVSEQTVLQNSNIVPPVSTPTYEIPDITVIDINLEDFEAQKLIESGIKFSPLMDADGIWNKGVFKSTHAYQSSDGVEIIQSAYIYKKTQNAEEDSKKYLREVSGFLQREPILDGSKNPIGERIVGITNDNQFVIILRKEKSNIIYSSPSLRHLLAFEKWRSK
jgi:hypothetical protein